MLNKDIRDILEGTHFFLKEGLINENLSGRAECMRKGLLLQLEGLGIPFQNHFLISNVVADSNLNLRVTSASLPYLNIDKHNGNGNRMSTCSSESTNYGSTSGSNTSSTGYSGDGIVSSSSDYRMQVELKKESEESFENNEETNDQECWQSKEILDCDTHLNSEDKDDGYASNMDYVSFRVLIATCDYHGDLMKKTKTLLPGVRNWKCYKCALVGSLLYFYLKEGDDKQKKVLDLFGYRIRETPIEENKLNSRRRDFGFELYSLGKKTHMFFTHKKGSRDRWIINIKRAISRSASKNGHSVVHWKQQTSFTESDDGSSEESSESEDDVYEELHPSDLADQTSIATNHWQHKEGNENNYVNQDSAYYTVQEEEEEAEKEEENEERKERGKLIIKNISKSYFKEKLKIPPKRPPAPNIRNQANQKRPLPDAPKKQYEFSDQFAHDEIYCEIDEDLNDFEIPKRTLNDNDNVSKSLDDLLNDDNSLSKEIFDAIINQNSSSKTANVIESNLKISQKSNENYNNIFSDSYPCKLNVSWKMNNEASCNPPPLPAKGVSLTRSSDADSEYSVPSSTTLSGELYDVPSSSSCKSPSNSDSNSNLASFIDVKNSIDQLNLEVKSIGKYNWKDVRSTTDEENKNLDDKFSTNQKIISNEKLKFEICNQNQVDQALQKSTSYVKHIVAKLNEAECFTENTVHILNKKNSMKNGFHYGNSENDHDSNSNNTPSKNERIDMSLPNENENLSKNPETLRINEFPEHILPDRNAKNSKENKKVFELSNGNALCKETTVVYIAKFAFVSSSPESLNFSRGDEILISERPREGRFWKGIVKGKEGLIPKEYLRKKI